MANNKTPNKKPLDQTLTKAGKLVAGVRGHKPKAKRGTKDQPSEVHMDWYRQWTRMGRSLSAISRIVGVHESSVREACHKVQDWIFRDGYADAKRFRDQQTEISQLIIEESLIAWEKSKQPEVSTVTESGSTEKGGWDKTSTKETPQNGNPAYMHAALAAQASIRAMWGVDAPKKQDITTNGGLIPLTDDVQTRKQLVRAQLLASLVDLEQSDDSGEPA